VQLGVVEGGGSLDLTSPMTITVDDGTTSAHVICGSFSCTSDDPSTRGSVVVDDARNVSVLVIIERTPAQLNVVIEQGGVVLSSRAFAPLAYVDDRPPQACSTCSFATLRLTL
jgi:hypothetical protein